MSTFLTWAKGWPRGVVFWCLLVSFAVTGIEIVIGRVDWLDRLGLIALFYGLGYWRALDRYTDG